MMRIISSHLRIHVAGHLRVDVDILRILSEFVSRMRVIHHGLGRHVGTGWSVIHRCCCRPAHMRCNVLRVMRMMRGICHSHPHVATGGIRIASKGGRHFWLFIHRLLESDMRRCRKRTGMYLMLMFGHYRCPIVFGTWIYTGLRGEIFEAWVRKVEHDRRLRYAQARRGG